LPSIYDDNSKDEDEEARQAGRHAGPSQRARLRKWDRMKDAEDCLMELAGEQASVVREELR